MFDSRELRQNLQIVIDDFEKELSGFRIGRATPSLVENINVNVYGSRIPISQIGNINVVDAHLLTINPWDKGNVDEVVKAILDSNIGLNPISEGDLIRIPIPPITEERRKELVKYLGEIGENAKIKIRQVRKQAVNDLKKSLDSKEITEDEEKKTQDQIQNTIDEFNAIVDDLTEKKRAELLTV
jgi:ribosome recycling factor